MQASHRDTYNHALEYAIDLANQLSLPLLVIASLNESYPVATLRHYQFLFEGLQEVSISLKAKGIPFRLYKDSLAINVAERAGVVVTDRGYLKHQRRWRENLANHLFCQVIEVESDVVVPVETVSEKEEYAARTLRPKIHRHLQQFLVPLAPGTPLIDGLKLDLEPGLNVHDLTINDQFDVDQTVMPVQEFQGGYTKALKRLKRFLSKRLPNYAENRNDISRSYTTELSPYLHFGQISPLEVILRLLGHTDPSDPNLGALIEELIIRRELAINFVYYNQDYDQYSSLPSWALQTLDKHRDDSREYLYTLEDFESARTHDHYWNAAMIEMKKRGIMKGYMRMYWGKKILEWSKSPEHAFETTLYLNNKYFLDGHDPNSYANVAWILGKHDRPWKERPIFGTIRYMNANGLKRKFDVEEYVRWVHQL